MSGYIEAVVVLLLINMIAAYAAYLPLAAGQLNLGVAGFMAVGAYLAAYVNTTYGVSVFTAIVLAVLVGGVVGFLVAVPIVRTRGIYLALATFAFGEVVTGLIVNIPALGGAAGYVVLGHIPGAGVALAGALVFLAMLYLSATGFALCLTAVNNDDAAAAVFGMSTRALRVAAFTLSGALAGLAGALTAFHFSFVEAQRFEIGTSISIVLFVLLGGSQTVWGPLVGALFFTLLPEMLRTGGEWRYVLFALVIILVMAVRSEGVVTRRLTLRVGAIRWRRHA